MLAPNTLCTAANKAAPWSVVKWGAKMHPGMHFLLKNLQAPQGVAAGVWCGGADLNGLPVRFLVAFWRLSDELPPALGSAMMEYQAVK